MFTHIHYVRLVFLAEDASGFAGKVPPQEWLNETDANRIAESLESSGEAVRQAVQSLIESKQDMLMHYDHPLLFIQHMIWHEGYHHGQIKLALKLAGHRLEDKQIGALTWRIWMNKTPNHQRH